MATTETRAKTIQSVDRAAALIKAIADSPNSPTVNELATMCGLNRSTTWRLLATLDSHGLIERDPISQRYSLGYALLRIAAGADVDPLVRRGRPVLEQLARETGETTNLAVARRFSLVYVDQVDPPHVMAPNWYGRTVPLHATSTGKAYLAFLPEQEQEAVLPRRLERYTRTTVTDRRRLGGRARLARGARLRRRPDERRPHRRRRRPSLLGRRRHLRVRGPLARGRPPLLPRHGRRLRGARGAAAADGGRDSRLLPRRRARARRRARLQDRRRLLGLRLP